MKTTRDGLAAQEVEASGSEYELAFDPGDSLLLVITPVPERTANPPSPFGTLIKVGTNCALTLGTIIPFPFAISGAEQPVWGAQRFSFPFPM
jgi:hypothetical protein